jgi:hypothetical protein
MNETDTRAIEQTLRIGARPETVWRKVRMVSSPSGLRVTSTRVEPGAMAGTPSGDSQPKLNTIRSYGTSSRNSPCITGPAPISTRHVPPGRGSSSAPAPHQSHIRCGSVQ